MCNLENSSQSLTSKNSSLRSQSLNFIAAGIGCNCLIALFEIGIFNKLVVNKKIAYSEIRDCKSPIGVHSALTTLDKCGIVRETEFGFEITSFGIAIAEFTGLISMLFDGYGDVLAQQNRIVRGEIPKVDRLIRGEAVSKAAVQLAKNTFDPVLQNEFAHLRFSGTICDLGCGYGRMLSQICEIHGNTGLGFDSELEVVNQARELFQGTNISIEWGNITNLQGVWEDVVVLMQCHVFHDFVPDAKCIGVINSFLGNFPNLKYFFYLDSVAPSAEKNEFLPGFDYVHGLLGIPTRTYEETITMFSHSRFALHKEVLIEGLPNTFLWILTPKQGI